MCNDEECLETLVELKCTNGNLIKRNEKRNQQKPNKLNHNADFGSLQKASSWNTLISVTHILFQETIQLLVPVHLHTILFTGTVLSIFSRILTSTLEIGENVTA